VKSYIWLLHEPEHQRTKNTDIKVMNVFLQSLKQTPTKNLALSLRRVSPYFSYSGRISFSSAAIEDEAINVPNPVKRTRRKRIDPLVVVSV